jgi:phosphopantothenoylcysteine decarboxylase/phosphopantothenate--cysteine ligase
MNVVIGICGGIAVYKICDLVRILIKAGHNVNVIMTKNACEFVSPLTFRTLSQNLVAVEMFEEPDNYNLEHISLAKRADLFVIAPATLNVIGKVANGIGDDILTTTVSATTAPVLFVPAMNTNMYNNKILQKNIEVLKTFGYHFMEPATGLLACGDVGSGLLPEISLIHKKIEKLLEQKKDLTGRTVLITAGPTIEAIDPVRYISNHSSGKMGYALADVAIKRGAKVILVSGPCHIKACVGVEFIGVSSAEEMHRSVLSKYEESDILIMVAAVADYKCEKIETHKIKKSEDEVILKLVKNPDIAKDIGSKKGNRLLVTFCAETQNLIENAKIKIKSKNSDIIVANDITKEGSLFGGETNIVTILDKDGGILELPKLDKTEVAERIIDCIISFENNIKNKNL